MRHKDLSNYLNTAVMEQELGVEASSAEKGPLEGKPAKLISALTSWEGGR